MSRLRILISIWMVTFIVGFTGFLMYAYMGFDIWPLIAQLDANIKLAILAGFVTSLLSLVTISVWAKMTSNN